MSAVAHEISDQVPIPAAIAGDVEPTPPALSRPVSVAIVIPVHNKIALTTQCLDTILAEDEPLISCDIVVVNDGSTDMTANRLLAYAGRIAVITNTPGKGFAGACNVGANASRGNYILLLNNDTIPTAGWLNALLAYAEAQPAAGIVGAKLLFPDNTVQHCGVAFGFDRYPRHLYIGFPADHPAVNRARQFQAVTGACLLIRRTLWEQLGGFDLAYRNGWEDVDLCLRARAAGHQVHYCPDSVIYHLESVSRDIRSSEERANRERFVASWHGTIVPDDFAFYVADGLVSIRYQPRYPLEMRVSPIIAGVVETDSVREGDRLLAERAKQVSILLRNNIVLNTRVLEAEQRMLAAEERTRVAYNQLRAAGLPLAEPAPSATEITAPTGRIIGSVEQPGQVSEPVRDGTVQVSGWALSPYGIGAVTALLDGVAAGTLRYGLPRPDVAQLHPGFPNEGHAGFAGPIAVGNLPPGQHTLTLRIADRRGQFADAVVPFLVAGPDRVLAQCDEPRPGTRLPAGTDLTIRGWALAASPVRRVQAGIGTRPPADLTIGLPRPELASSHDYHPDFGQAGFAGTLPAGDLPPGPHQLRLTITSEADGAVTLTVPFVVPEPTARPPQPNGDVADGSDQAAAASTAPTADRSEPAAAPADADSVREAAATGADAPDRDSR